MSRRDNWYRHLRNEAARTLQCYVREAGLRRVEDMSLPVPVIDITAVVLRFESLYTDEMDPLYSGFIDFDQELIRINTQDRTPEHQRFSHGHEIGHGCLHRDSGTERMFRCRRDVVGAPEEATSLGVDWSRFDVAGFIALRQAEERTWKTRRKEIEANVFASALVMPGAHLLQFTEQERTDPIALARHFGVSVAAMRWRLEDISTPVDQPSLF